MERRDRLTWRASGPVLAAAIAGLLFAPVFGLVPLLVPVLVPALSVLAVTILCGRRPGLVDWRPLLATLAGLLAVSETLLFGTTAFGLPTGRTVAALADGVTSSWQLVLESTWPARPEPDLLIFVPLLVVVAAVLGAELRLRAAPAALLPSLAVVVLSQLYAVPGPGPAMLAALAYAVAAAVTLATGATLLRLAAAGAVSVLAAGLTLILLPDAKPRFSLQDGRPAAVEQTAPANPLDEIAYRLENPTLEVFRVAGGSGVDRWPLVVLDDFDGVTWNTTEEYRRMGTRLPPGPQVTVRTRPVRATVTVTDTGGPWLPTQTWPAAVDRLTPLVIPDHGMLMRWDAPSGPAEYDLEWWQPEVDATLREAPIDPSAPGGLNGVGDPPAAVEELAVTAMGEARASFQGALVLEKYLRDNYHVASGEDRPTGHGWPKLSEFLLDTQSGTSEQFAAAYVALARMAGIPARLVVGFRAPAPDPATGAVVVHNSDVLAWPEVAVQGVGWVQLDPIASAAGTATGSGLAAETARARDALPSQDLRDASITPVAPAPAPAPGGPGLPWLALLAVPLIGWLTGVPALWTVRSWRRRRRAGAAAVLGAWAEARDRLRAHGVQVTPGMTVRDLSTAAGPVADDGTTGEIRTLAGIVDRALWSGDQPSGDDVARSWTAVRAVRRGLARQGRLPRVRALLDPRPLLPPASPTGYRWRPGWPWAR